MSKFNKLYTLGWNISFDILEDFLDSNTNSPYIKVLMKFAGMKDIEELKEAAREKLSKEERPKWKWLREDKMEIIKGKVEEEEVEKSTQGFSGKVQLSIRYKFDNLYLLGLPVTYEQWDMLTKESKDIDKNVSIKCILCNLIVNKQYVANNKYTKEQIWKAMERPKWRWMK